VDHLFSLNGESPVSEQVAAHVRSFIRSGRWPVDHRLPSTRALAEAFSVAPLNVQTGMQQLVREGLLTRVTGRGTFVRKTSRKLACIGVYDSCGVDTHAEMAFSRRLLTELQGLGAAADIDLRVFVDTRDRTTLCDKPPLDLANACAGGEIQGLITLSAEDNDWPWLNKLPVPLAAIVNWAQTGKVQPDRSQLMDLAVRDLARRGCRSVGLLDISRVDMRAPNSLGARAVSMFKRRSHELGVETRDAWMLLPSPDFHDDFLTHEEYGYIRFKRLWSLAERPEGLVVIDDVVARGVLLALLEHRVHVPEELQLTIQRNRECKLLCPVPASFVELSVREVAAALMKDLSRQFNAVPRPVITVPFRLVPAERAYHRNEGECVGYGG